MSDQARRLRGLMESRLAPDPVPDTAGGACTITVTSGKGGVGKSNVALNLAIALARLDSAVCLLDANMGLGNIDLLCGLNGYWNLSHVVSGARLLKDVVLEGPGGIHVVPGASGLSDLADCPEGVQRELLKQMSQLERDHDFLIVDTGTGIHRPIRKFVTVADIVLIVTTPEPTSIADAYATVKSISNADELRMHALVNQAESIQQARVILDRLKQTSRLFLRRDVESAGAIPHDLSVTHAVARRTPYLLDAPHSHASLATMQLAQRIKDLTIRQPGRGEFFNRLWTKISRHAA